LPEDPAHEAAKDQLPNSQIARTGLPMRRSSAAMRAAVSPR
jgi:hypothetical protein